MIVGSFVGLVEVNVAYKLELAHPTAPSPRPSPTPEHPGPTGSPASANRCSLPWPGGAAPDLPPRRRRAGGRSAARRSTRTWLDEQLWVDFGPRLAARRRHAARDRRRDRGVAAGPALDVRPHGRRSRGSRRFFRRSNRSLHPALVDARAALEARYGVRLSGPGFNYYRDGRDSVAPHSDRELRELDDTIVAILTLGARRPFLLKAKTGGAVARPRARVRGPARDGRRAPSSAGSTRSRRSRAAGPRVSVSWRWSTATGDRPLVTRTPAHACDAMTDPLRRVPQPPLRAPGARGAAGRARRPRPQRRRTPTCTASSPTSGSPSTATPTCGSR